MTNDAETNAGSSFGSIQAADTELLLQLCRQHLGWKDGGGEGEILVDLGCGSGVNSTHGLYAMFPKASKLIGVDISEDALEIAKKTHPKGTFTCCSIDDDSLPDLCRGQASKLVSCHVLNWLPDKAKCLRNVRDLLRPGGEAAIIFVPQIEKNRWKPFLNHPVWGQYFKNLKLDEPHEKTETDYASHYMEILNEVGLQTIYCKEQDRVFVYKSYEEFKRFIMSASTLTKLIPEEKREMWGEDAAQARLEFCQKGEGESIARPYSVLCMLVRKTSTAP